MDFEVGVTWKKERENYVNIELMYEKEKEKEPISKLAHGSKQSSQK